MAEHARTEHPADDVAAACDAVLGELGADARRVAPGEWGVSLEAGGWPLHVGLAVRGGLLRAQAEVCGPGQADPHALLHRNRFLELVRFTHTSAGAVWIEGDVPAAAVTPALVDRLLGGLLAAAEDLRAALTG